MRLSGWQLVAASSVLVAIVARAETRPQYGGSLRVTTRIAPASLDPADNTQPDSISRGNLTRLIFDTLVTMDDAGHIQPALASSWQSASNNQRWQFWLRRDIKFHDGSPLTADAVAASLRTANPAWAIYPNGDSVIVERSAPAPTVLAELALPRNAIAKRISGGMIQGTGPFHITDWQPGKRLTLAAEEGHWGGRAFLDSIVIEMGRNFRDQMISLELGKADIVEVPPEQAHRAMTENRRVVSSSPVELLALVFTKDRQSPEDGRLREALSLCIDRNAIRAVLLQGQGESAGGVLPNWMTGYEFVFPAEFNLQRAQQARSEVRQPPSWTLGYDPTDALGRLMAERIALNARDAGITLQLTGSSTSDLRIVRVSWSSSDAQLALLNLAAMLGVPSPRFAGSSVEDLYQAENALLQTQRVIPLFHLPATYAVGASVRNFELDRNGEWRLTDVWLGTEKP
jgi:peptide/nickel transport system substrate-binding protein